MPEPHPIREDDPTHSSVRGPVVLLVIVACAVVAIAAGGIRLVGPPMELSAGGAWMVRIFGALLVAGGVTALLAQRERLAPDTAGGADPSRFALTTAASIMAVVALFAVMAHPLAPRPASDDVPYVERPTTAPPGADTVPSPPPPPQLGLGLVNAGEDQLADSDSSNVAQLEGISNDTRERLAQMVRWALLLALALAGVWFLAHRLRWFGKAPADPLVTPEEAEEGLEGSLHAFEVSGEGPREQITAAYRRLLVVLERAEVPREAYEAPHEHLDRALGPLGIPSEPLHDLAGLYVRAHFGEGPVDEEHRDAAIRALETSLTHLRRLAAGGAAHLSRGSRRPRVTVETSK